MLVMELKVSASVSLPLVIQISRNGGLPLSEVADEWTSFSSSKSLQLDYDNIEKFSLWVQIILIIIILNNTNNNYSNLNIIVYTLNGMVWPKVMNI